ncbi:MAG: choice-of-anchor H family protein [Woeseiaceae bacterium]
MTAAKHIRIPFIVATMLLLSIAATTVIAAPDETRQSVSTQSTKAERDRGVPGKVTKDEFDALVIDGNRQATKPSATKSATSSRQSSLSSGATASNDFWFYSADVVLFNDHDNDGHFHGIDLLFDADTIYVEADVYAVVYLSLYDGPWNEYTATDNFTLFGSAAEDEYVIVTELVSGYPTGSYDLLIELFDAYDDSFLASYGPVDTSELAFLPLEDSNRDTPFDEPGTVVVHDHGGGSLGWLTILLLLGAARKTIARTGLKTD